MANLLMFSMMYDMDMKDAAFPLVRSMNLGNMPRANVGNTYKMVVKIHEIPNVMVIFRCILLYSFIASGICCADIWLLRRKKMMITTTYTSTLAVAKTTRHPFIRT